MAFTNRQNRDSAAAARATLQSAMVAEFDDAARENMRRKLELGDQKMAAYDDLQGSDEQQTASQDAITQYNAGLP